MASPADPTEPTTPDPDILMGWKAIASFLSKSVRSAQRWEQDHGLPTHRIVTDEGQIAYARRSEIEVWMRSKDRPSAVAPDASQAPPSPSYSQSRRRIWLSGSGLALMIVLIFVWKIARPFTSAKGPLAGVYVVPHAIEGRDGTGNVLWTLPFADDIKRAVEFGLPVDDTRGDTGGRIDLRGDGTMLTLLPIVFPGTRVGVRARPDALYALTDDGHVAWSVSGD